MSDNITFVETCNPDNNLVEIVMRQTNFTREEAITQLTASNNDHVLVIKKYMGITEKKEPEKTRNQEIFRQFRYKLNSPTSNITS
jgi:hypothetical protein